MADSALTLRNLLWGAEIGAGAASCVSTAITDVRYFATVVGAPLQAIMNEAAEVLSEALDVNLGDILASAWNDSRKVRAAADPEKHRPDETILLPLLEHEVRSEHKPVLEFTIDGRTVCKLEFVVELALQLEGVVLRIRTGRIRSVAAGSCHAAATLSCGGAELARRETRDIALPLCIDYGEGIPIPMQTTTRLV